MKRDYMPLSMAVFLVFCALLASAVFIKKNDTLNAGGFMGSISFISSAYGAQSSQALDNLSAAGGAYSSGQAQTSLLVAPGYSSGSANYVSEEEGTVFDSNDAMVKDPGGAFVDSTSQSGIISYAVKPGDTLASIAQYFGITANTITTANPKIHSDKVVPGEILKILPVSGILYSSSAGDTLRSIATSFNVPESQIITANPSLSLSSLNDLTFITPGTSFIIPGGGSVN